MTDNLTADEIIEIIVTKTQFIESTVEKMIDDTIVELEGMVDRDGSAIIVANNLKVKLFEKPNEDIDSDFNIIQTFDFSKHNRKIDVIEYINDKGLKQTISIDFILRYLLDKQTKVGEPKFQYIAPLDTRPPRQLFEYLCWRETCKHKETNHIGKWPSGDKNCSICDCKVFVIAPSEGPDLSDIPDFTDMEIGKGLGPAKRNASFTTSLENTVPNMIHELTDPTHFNFTFEDYDGTQIIIKVGATNKAGQIDKMKIEFEGRPIVKNLEQLARLQDFIFKIASLAEETETHQGILMNLIRKKCRSLLAEEEFDIV